MNEGLAGAKQQAEFEYPECLGPWQAIPAEVPAEDVVEYALRIARP